MSTAVMHSCIVYILLLLSSLPSALSVPHLGSVNFTDKRIACQQSGTFHKFIFFSAANDTAFHYGIKTGYTEYYPGALESALKLDDFHLLWRDDANACGWQQARNVRHSGSIPMLGKNRGEIYWKYADVTWVSPKNSKLAGHWKFDSADHKPPHVGALPPNATLDKITNVLRDNEPAADVYQLTTICLGYLSGFLGVLVILSIALRYIDNMDYGESDDVELPAIKTNSLDKPLPASASTDTIATSTCSGDDARGADESGHSTPPPRYSQSGASEHIRGGSAISRLREAYGIDARHQERTSGY
ncbi:hypothetical protein HBI38_072790 [Parastagonospora nodorum]|nr:hypothetical protein HBI73_040890 [Parastagonospora nodorum]KAH5381577.1 hypothetical protein HBI33_137100 [Parastagonospora nodorum]KAH6273784.1 hypothetical protein HBI41_074020 [Parastagonospora nodorum]KAH6294307.1 hypothetical protein HBI40_065480 [Parastagonospora nodorum]KAH6324759.1 hypothetical protein HBI38_072790 [Parastagonospora nodorum]